MSVFSFMLTLRLRMWRSTCSSFFFRLLWDDKKEWRKCDRIIPLRLLILGSVHRVNETCLTERMNLFFLFPACFCSSIPLLYVPCSQLSSTHSRQASCCFDWVFGKNKRRRIRGRTAHKDEGKKIITKMTRQKALNERMSPFLLVASMMSMWCQCGLMSPKAQDAKGPILEIDGIGDRFLT